MSPKDRKTVETLKAKLALKGYRLGVIDDGSFVIRGLTVAMLCADLEALEMFAASLLAATR